ncbi:MAG TPA: tripartite tricarboxylate transporter substrate binding protein [Beijerinckiaceae bacterium]|jgi:tripartite-type tricarboxylate transporter receptor subunit TctC
MKTIVLALSALLAGGCPALAQEPVAAYPSRTIRIVVPVPAGGGVDVAARLVAEGLQQKWGPSVVVENRPGAGGNVGSESFSRMPADGYALLVAPPAPFVVNMVLYKNLRYDASKFQPVTIISGSANVVATPPGAPHKDAKDFLAYVKANPGKVNYASPGVGTTSHLTAAWLAQLLGAEMVHVPYSGTAPALNDLAAGHVDMMIGDVGAILPLAQAGKLRIIAATTREPIDAAPDAPTLQSLGLDGFVSETWTAMAAPEGASPELARKIADAVRDVVTAPEAAARLRAMSTRPMATTPEEMRAIVTAESARWRAVAEKANLKVD